MTTQFSSLAGHTALDLVNTIEWRLDPGRSSDDLGAYDSVLSWCLQFGLIEPDEHARLLRQAQNDQLGAAREHRAVLDLRESIHAIARNKNAAAARAAAHAVAENYAESIGAAELVRSADRLVWVDRVVGLATPRHRIVRLANSMLTTSPMNFVTQCHDDACGYLFIDTSPRHNRRWCAAADCGNRNRARRHYRRQQESGLRES